MFSTYTVCDSFCQSARFLFVQHVHDSWRTTTKNSHRGIEVTKSVFPVIWAELVNFFKSWLSKINCTQFAGVELTSIRHIRTSVFIEQKLLKWPACQPWAALLKEKKTDIAN